MVLALAGTLAFTRTAEAAPHVDGGTTYVDTLAIKACAAEPLTLPTQTEVALQATLLVRVPEGVGSAFLISPDGFALTAAHVVGEHDKVTVVGYGGTTVEATVVRVDENEDSALIAIPSFGSTPCMRPHEGRPAIGSDVFVLGSPAGVELSFSVSKGIVSGLREIAEHRFVQLDASVNPGNSGGPVVGSDGAVLGIASWKLSHVSVEGIAFAVPIDAALASLQVELAAETDGDWRERRGRRRFVEEPKTSSRAIAAPRPTPSGQYQSPYDPELRKRRVARGALLGAGIPVFSVGVVTIAISGGLYYGLDEMSRKGWLALRGINTTGWVLASVGGAAIVAAVSIPRKPRKQKTSSTNTQVTVDPTGLSLRGTF